MKSPLRTGRKLLRQALRKLFALLPRERRFAIYRAFVAMAREVSGRERPRLLVSTASGRDPYAAIDFYLALFAQAGAEVRAPGRPRGGIHGSPLEIDAQRGFVLVPADEVEQGRREVHVPSGLGSRRMPTIRRGPYGASIGGGLRPCGGTP